MAGNGIGVLVVDDEPIDIAVVRKCLETAGYAIITAADHDDGLAKFEAHLDQIDLLLTDISLPGRTGIDLAITCLSRKPSLKVLFMSGWVGAKFLDYFGIPKGDPFFLAADSGRSGALIPTEVGHSFRKRWGAIPAGSGALYR